VAQAVATHRAHLAREVLATTVLLNERDGREPDGEAAVTVAAEPVRLLLWR
jgi:hypothetical protein